MGRAGFGGGLLSTGVAATAIAVWAAPTASRWLALAIAGASGFVAAIGVHVAIGYVDPTHVGLAVMGAVVLAAGLVLTIPSLDDEPGTVGRAAATGPA